MKIGKVYVECEANFDSLHKELEKARSEAKLLKAELDEIRPKWYELIWQGIKQLFTSKKSKNL